jgi:hypothetical protein
MISINLLPPELAVASKKKEKHIFFNQISIGVLILMIVITALVFGFTFAQSQAQKKSQENVATAVSQISALKPKEEVISIVKNRLGGISGVISQDSIQTKAFNLIFTLVPENMLILSFTVDKSGKVELSGETQSISALDQLFEGLTDPKKNEGKISSAKIESLNRRLGGKIRFDLTINLAKT